MCLVWVEQRQPVTLFFMLPICGVNKIYPKKLENSWRTKICDIKNNPGDVILSAWDVKAFIETSHDRELKALGCYLQNRSDFILTLCLCDPDSHVVFKYILHRKAQSLLRLKKIKKLLQNYGFCAFGHMQRTTIQSVLQCFIKTSSVEDQYVGSETQKRCGSWELLVIY